MRTNVSTPTTIVLTVMALACCLGAASQAAAQAPAATAMPLDGTTLRISFGHEDKTPTAWDGRIEISPGKLVSLTTQAKRRASVDGATWRLRTVEQTNQKTKKKFIVQPVLFATLAAPLSAAATITTPKGEFAVPLETARLGVAQTFQNGQVQVTRVPLSSQLTSGPTDEDLPTMARGPDGTVWVAYVSYKGAGPLKPAVLHDERKFDSCIAKGNGDQLRLMKFDGKTWSAPIDVTGPGLDIWRPTIAVDGKGGVWVVWSQKVDGDWDLYSRSYSNGALGKRIRVTKAKGADGFPVAVTNPKTGAVAVVWQGWRDGSFDILSCELSGGEASPETRLDTNPANQWAPSAAYDSQGRLHVAYDTYENGAYDVRLVYGANTASPRRVEVAASPLYEARPSVAVDKDDRVWIAYEEAGPEWGKDFGTKWKGPAGTRFYISREVRVRCYDGKTVKEVPGLVPSEKVNASYPRGLTPAKRRLSLPRITFDEAGRLWLLYRRHATTAGQGERWVSFGTYHDGARWADAFVLANSVNLLDNRPSMAPVAGGMLVIHSTDGRKAGSKSATNNDLYCSVLRASGDVGDPPLEAPSTEHGRIVVVHPNERADVKRMRGYRASIGGKSYRLLRGEFHRHTELTAHQDMDGTLEEMWRYGLDVAAMDWIGNGDHDNGNGVEYLWWIVQKQTDFFHHPPSFMPMFTYERSRVYPSGHRNAMFAYRGVRPLPQIPGGKDRVFGTPEGGSPDIKTFYAYLKRFNGICASHTSATGMGTDWRDNDPEVEPVVEIFQGCRQSYEHEGAPASAKDAKDSVGGLRPAGFVWNALKKGYRLGFESSSDHYSAHISYAVVYAEAPTREAILDGFKKRHCYGANDNILLDVRCGEKMMGDVFEIEGKPTLKIHAEGTLPIARVSVVRGVGSETPVYVYDGGPNKKVVDLTWTDDSPTWGEANYYYVRVEQQRPKDGAGALAWASPMWITPKQ